MRFPSNHSPEFAPVIEPTLRVGIEAMLGAASAWLVPARVKPDGSGVRTSSFLEPASQ
jgi:hippurate hydrolase